MHFYCTFFDDGYLARGVVMIESLLAHDSGAQVWVLALSPSVVQVLNTRFGAAVKVVPLDQFESYEPALPSLRIQRSPTEYIFTLTAPWTRFVMQEASAKGDWVTYIDADMWFLSSTEPVYEEIADASVAIVGHRYPRTLQRLNRFGTYNVGWVGFRNDEEGRRCLDWWVEATLEWCFDRVEDGKFADQGYLDSFTDQTARLRVIANPGVDLAPWNLARHTVRSVRSQAIVDGVPAVCFHFHGIWKRGDRYYWKNFRYHARTTSVVREVLFAPYLRELSRVAGEVQPYVADARHRGRAAGVRSRLKTVLARLVGDSLFVSQAR